MKPKIWPGGHIIVQSANNAETSRWSLKPLKGKEEVEARHEGHLMKIPNCQEGERRGAPSYAKEGLQKGAKGRIEVFFGGFSVSLSCNEGKYFIIGG